MGGRSIGSRLGAVFVAAAMALAPGGPTIRAVQAAALQPPSQAEVTSAADICTTYDCYTVAFALTGGGSGRAQSTNAQFEPDGILDCPMVRGIIDMTLCSHKYPDTTGAGGVVVYVKITPDPGSQVCDENGCTVEPRLRSRFFTTSGTFAETFNLLVYDVRLAKAGSGSGRITSEPPYLDCGTSCETSLEYGEKLVFTADPDPGSRFSKWTGACAGKGAVCKITLTADITTSATFTALGAATPEPSAEPTAAPTEAPVASRTPPSTAVPPTAAPTVEPTLVPIAPANDSGTAGLIPIVIGIAIVLLVLIAIGTGIAMRRKPTGP